MSTQRTITVFSTKGKRKEKITTDVKTWGELKPLIEQAGYDVKKLHATESVRRSDLAHKDAQLPDGDFTVFMRPKKTKSGGKDYNSMGFKQLRDELTEEDKSAISEQTGKNWTRCSTQDLKDYLNAKAEAGGSPAPEATQEASEDVTEEAQEEGVSNADRLASIATLLEEIGADCDSEEVNERISIVNDELEGLKEAVAGCDEDLAEKQRLEAEAAEIEEADQAETQELADEANDLLSGF